MAPTASEDGKPPAPPLRGRRRDSLPDDDDPGRDISDDDDDEEAETSGSDDESEEELEIPPDPIHEAHMQSLRRENAFLLHVTAEQDAVLEQMRLRISEIQEATSRRQRELEDLREARRIRETEAGKKAEEERQGNGEGCQPPETGKRGGDDDKDGPSPVPI